jgi:hypothetical protein
MNDERDPELEVLFSRAEEESLNGDFAARVMTGVNNRSRNVYLVRFLIVILIVGLELILSTPLTGALGEVAAGLSEPLFEAGESWLAIIASPLNSVAGVIGLVLLFLHYLYRRVIR